MKTTSQILRKHKEIEEQQSNLYSLLAEKHSEYKEIFNNLAEECMKHMERAQRAYREGVTDAFEVGFQMNPLQPEYYVLHEPEGSLKNSVRTMIDNEETIIKFCHDIASNSGNLLPGVPETFERLAKRKTRNIKRLREINGG